MVTVNVPMKGLCSCTPFYIDGDAESQTCSIMHDSVIHTNSTLALDKAQHSVAVCMGQVVSMKLALKQGCMRQC